MVNLADLPNAGPLSGSETLPMQQGAGAVKVTVNSLFSRAAGQALPFEHVGIGERGRIDNNGYFRWGPTAYQMQVGSPSNTYSGTTIQQDYIHVARSSANPKLVLQTLNQSGTATAIQFWYGSSPCGQITNTSTTTSYGTSSDYRLPWKAGHVPLTGSGEFIDRLKPYYFPLVGMAGFFAHEFAEVSPSSVSGEKDAVDESGEPIYQSMQASTSDVMANIIAELQSLRQRVAALEAA